MPENLAGKVFTITGAGKGLGRAYARHLAGQGARIVVNNRTHAGDAESSADRVAAEIRAAGGDAVADYGSVEDPSSGEALLQTALTTFGRLDGLVANAGVIENCTFRKQTLDGLARVVDINLTGTIHAVHPAFRHLCEHGGGSIVVSASSAGLFGDIGLPAYSASKAAVLGLMYSLAIEGARKRVAVNAIAPYATTAMTEDHVTPDVAACMSADAVAPVVAWLLTGAVCGEIVIAGADRISRARMQVSDPLPVSDGAVDWATLASMPVNRSFGSAGEHFRSFMAGLPDPNASGR